MVKFDFFGWSAKWLGSVCVVNIEMAIGLVQWFSFAAMLGPYSKPFELVTLGSKSSRFAIPKLECDWVVIFFAARLHCKMYTYCIYLLHKEISLLILVLVMICF